MSRLKARTAIKRLNRGTKTGEFTWSSVEGRSRFMQGLREKGYEYRYYTARHHWGVKAIWIRTS